ncbi:MAG: hypothetical protein IJZ42_12265 [Lachnospiraceae bacterium]|nr:hypothetical protein [Lachnospiraceae bacterium]
MSNKTKIVVLRMKEIVYSGIFALLGILFLVLLIIMFVPDKKEDESIAPTPSVSDAQYIPGVYSTSINLGNQTVDVEVMVDANHINSIELINLTEDVETMFPLIEPSLDDLASQIIANQSLENVTYPDDAKYTSLVLLEAIELSINKAKIPTSESSESTGSSDSSENN